MHSVFVFVCGPKVSLIFSNNMTWDNRHLITQHIQSCDNHHPEKKVGCGCHLLFRQFLSKRRRRKSRHIACVWFFFLRHSQGNDVGFCFLFYFFSSKRGRRKSGRISCASNSFGGKVKELKLDIFFSSSFFFEARAAQERAHLLCL